MSDSTIHPWRDVDRAAVADAERRREHETRLDQVLLAVAAGLKRPFSRARARAAGLARLVEQEQPRADVLTDARLRAAAADLRPQLVRHGFAPAVVARSFALIRAAAARTVGLSHFPVQLMGGHVILQGMLAEMATGEGKTVTATLPAATAALAGMPVHIVTVNDYLAHRDGTWMRPVYEALGLTVGIVQPGQPTHERQAAYAADITYCTNKDVGFDYLRDALARNASRHDGRLVIDKLLGRTQARRSLLLRGLHFAIVDEADSVLIDEARTPLIIAGPRDDADADGNSFAVVLALAAELEPDADYLLDAGERTLYLTEQGRDRLAHAAPRLPSHWRSASARVEMVVQALVALRLLERDMHYLVRDDKVHIVDESTGRVLADRSWEHGLQQLVETKEGCPVTSQQSTLARITYQSLFRRYLRVGGMTGTTMGVAAELEAVYALPSVSIPPHRPVQRTFGGVRLFVNDAQKWDAVAQTAATVAAGGRPVLIGTRSVAASEQLSAVLTRYGIGHVVLNARQDREEAAVVARAGQPRRITVATNMAGRGTDIQLPDAVVDNGGLHVILTEFHESRRVDRQLFGRCARQGQPGSCEAIVSLEDDLFRHHAGALCRVLASHFGSSIGPLPQWCVSLLRSAGQGAAQAADAQARRRTMESERRLERSMAYAGRAQ